MSIKRHTVYNLAGSLTPMVVSIVTVPIYLRLIGDIRYGVLAVVWLFLGYFGLFDPGITRAAAFHLARLHADSQREERESVFWTALVINGIFGIIGAVILYAIARPLFMSTFKMPQAMRGEVITSLPWLAASIPVFIVTGVLGGALQARDQFGILNSISVFNAVAIQLAPLGVALWHGPDLTWLIPAVLIARTIGTIPSCIAVFRTLPLGVGGRFRAYLVKSLFSYGGWVTITNLLNPVLTTIDRMLIGSLLSVQAVAFYTVPFNMVGRASVIPASLAASLFPKLSRSSTEDSARLAFDGLAALAAVMTPMVVAAIAVFPSFMRIWVGSEFASSAAPVGVVLLVGIWINGLAFIPYGHLQAIERPDIVAKFHALEILPFVALLWLGLHNFGLIGAAWAWTIRVAADGALLFIVAGQIPNWRRILPGGLIVLLAAFFTPATALSAKTGIESALLLAAFVWSWRISPSIRSLVTYRFRRVRRAPMQEAA